MNKNNNKSFFSKETLDSLAMSKIFGGANPKTYCGSAKCNTCETYINCSGAKCVEGCASKGECPLRKVSSANNYSIGCIV